MALVAKEILGSGNASTEMQTTGEVKHSATRQFLVYDDVGDATDSDIATIVLFDDLPQMGDLHDDFEFLRVTKRSIARDAGRNDAYNITLSYEFMPDEPSEENLVSESGEAAGQFVDVWRSQPNKPINISNPTADDIGGTAIDQAGTPTSLLLKQQTYQTSFINHGAIPISTLFDAIGKRNSVTWNGFEAGFLVYQGVSFQTKTATSYTRTDKFLYDAFAHLRQIVASVDGDLNPTLDSNGNAETVRFVQPFPETVSFNNLGIPI